MEKKDRLRVDVYGAKERSIEELAWLKSYLGLVSTSALKSFKIA